MNEVLMSNDKSLLQHILKRRDRDPIAYNYSTNFQNRVKTAHYVSANIDPVSYGETIYFDIPKSGYLEKIVVEMTLTCTGDNTYHESERLGEDVCEWMELRTLQGNRTIQRITRDQTKMRTDYMDVSTRSRIEAMERENVDFNNTTVVVYCPFYGFFSEHPSKFLDTNYIQDLRFFLKVHDTKEEIGLPQDITNMSFRIQATYRMDILDPFYHEIRLPLTYLTANFYDEPTNTILANTTTFSYHWKVPKSVFATHLLLQDASQILYEITGLTVRINGKVFYETNSRLALVDAGWYEHSDLPVDNRLPAPNNGNRFLTIYWAMFNDRNHNTNVVNFADVGTVDVDVSFATNASDRVLKTFHEYFDFTEINDRGEIFRKIIK